MEPLMRIDLNADVGEGCGDDAALLPLVTSANIACGAHAGDERTMRETVHLAQRFGVTIGAHPSYPDRAGFGRNVMNRSPEEIYDDVRSQIEALASIAGECGASLHHVKAHGALYNVAARDRSVADAVSRAVADTSNTLLLYGLAGGEQMESARAHGLRPVAEGFADRRYLPDGALVPRTRVDALIEDEEVAARQALSLVEGGIVQTICLHGDGPQALAFARRIRAALNAAGVAVAAVTMLALMIVPFAARASAPRAATDVLNLEARWVRAVANADATALARILAPSFVHVNYEGTVRYREDELRLVKQPKPYAQHTSEQTVDFAGNDVAIVRGINTITEGGKTVLRLRYTDVYVREGGSWRAVSAQETEIQKTRKR
jgi:UPF0271 protein